MFYMLLGTLITVHTHGRYTTVYNYIHNYIYIHVEPERIYQLQVKSMSSLQCFTTFPVICFTYIHVLITCHVLAGVH